MRLNNMNPILQKEQEAFEEIARCKALPIVLLSIPVQYKCEYCGCTWSSGSVVPYCITRTKSFLAESNQRMYEAGVNDSLKSVHKVADETYVDTDALFALDKVESELLSLIKDK